MASTCEWPKETIIVNRLRVRSSQPDAVQTRLRAEALLDSSRLSLTSLQGESIVCIRGMTDPLPGSLKLWGHGVGRASLEWQCALDARIDQLVHHASRPFHEAVPTGAGVILFRDRAELLTCLAIDWLAGELVSRWWWKCIFPNADLGRLAVTAWLEAPESVPAALDHLARRQRMSEFVRRINKNDVRALQQKLTFTFGLHALHSVPEEIAAPGPIQGVRPMHPDRAEGAGPIRPVELRSRPPRSRTDPPWRRWVPESDTPALDPDRQLLVGIGLMLHRAPAIVRTASFAADVLRWQQSLSSASPVFAGAEVLPSGSSKTVRDDYGSVRAASNLKNVEHLHPEAASDDLQSPEREVHGTVDEKPAASPIASDLSVPSDIRTSNPDTTSGAADDFFSTRSRPPGLTAAGKQDEPASSGLIDAEPPIYAARAAREAKKSETSDSVRSITYGKSTVMVQQVGKTTPPDMSSSSAQGSRFREDASKNSPAYNLQPAVVPEDRIETKLGGLFYLINVGLALNLYADFTRPLEPGLELPIWDFIELVGRRLLAGKSKRDPVWTLLARLAGRKGEEPGRSFEPPDEWRIPSEWLASFSRRSVWRWSVSEKRLRVRHHEGFHVLDVNVSGSIERQLQEEMRGYTGVAEYTLQRIEPQPIGKAMPLERWLDWLLTFLSARLRQAMGFDRRRSLSKVLLNRDARVEAGATRLDIYLSLDDLPIEVRLAGLDRDPGWVPAAGRFVAFHYQ